MPIDPSGMLQGMTGQMQPQMQSSHNPEHLDALVGELAKLQPELLQQIMGQLRGPAPTAPTPPAFTGLSPLAAAAGAMNPQQIPTLINQQMGPEQARYTQQQAAFEQAMQGRREALGAATGLASAGIRSDAAVDAARLRGPGMGARGQIRVVEGPDGKPALQEFINDGAGGFTPGKILATGQDTLRYLATPDGYIPVSSKTGETGSYVQKPGGGGPAYPPPPAGVATTVAATQASAQGLGSIKQLWSETQPKLRGPASYQGMISVGQGLAPNLTKDIIPTADYDTVQNFDSGVNRFVSDEIFRRSGKAATDRERAMFKQFFPLINDSEQIVDDKLARMRAAMDREYGALTQQYPATNKRKTAAQLADELGLK